MNTAATRQLPLDLVRPVAPTLDNFVIGSNAEALAALRALVSGAPRDPLIYLWGATGSGRTHLLTALADAASTQSHGHAYWWSARDDPEADGISLLDGVELLDAAAQIALFNRINAVRAIASTPGDRRACVMTGDAAPAHLALREDLRSRLAWGQVFRLQPLSDAQKQAALALQAQARGIPLDAAVPSYLLTHGPRDMRTLIAALDALDAFALARQKRITVNLVRQWLAAPPAPS